MSNKISIIVLLIFYCPVCMAYIDPGTGSLLIQGLIAGIAAGMYALKMYWHRVKTYFSSKKSDVEENDAEVKDQE